MKQLITIITLLFIANISFADCPVGSKSASDYNYDIQSLETKYARDRVLKISKNI